MIIPWNNAKPEDKIIFMHIPKTAGSSVRMSLQNIYGDYYFNLTPHGNPWPDLAGCEQFMAFSGHIQLDHPIYDRIDRFIHVTLLREPVARIKSQYNFLVETPYHPLHELAQKTPLKEILTNGNPAEAWGMSDLMVRHIGQGDLEQAKKNLTDKFTLFGFVESYEEFYNTLKSKLHWFCEPVHHDNVGSYDQVTFEDGIEDLIIEHNRLDIALYEYAKELQP